MEPTQLRHYANDYINKNGPVGLYVLHAFFVSEHQSREIATCKGSMHVHCKYHNQRETAYVQVHKCAGVCERCGMR